MKILLGVRHKVTGEEFLARGIEVTQKGEVTHVCIDGHPCTQWEPIEHFEVFHTTIEVKEVK